MRVLALLMGVAVGLGLRHPTPTVQVEKAPPVTQHPPVKR